MCIRDSPDRGGDEAKFKEISEAYETLSNPDKRKEYDMMLQFGGIPGQMCIRDRYSDARETSPRRSR